LYKGIAEKQFWRGERVSWKKTEYFAKH